MQENLKLGKSRFSLWNSHYSDHFLKNLRTFTHWATGRRKITVMAPKNNEIFFTKNEFWRQVLDNTSTRDRQQVYFCLKLTRRPLLANFGWFWSQKIGDREFIFTNPFIEYAKFPTLMSNFIEQKHSLIVGSAPIVRLFELTAVLSRHLRKSKDLELSF